MLDVRLRTATSLVASAFEVASAVETTEGWTVQRPVRGDLLQVAKPRSASLDRQAVLRKTPMWSLVRLDRDLATNAVNFRIMFVASLHTRNAAAG